MDLDTQQIELIGRSALRTELIKQGFEVAEPDRDNGFDFIIYTQPSFKAVPIQMKSSQTAKFGAYRKYEKFGELILIYVWHVMDKPRFFIMTYDETLEFVPDLNGQSWLKHNEYVWNKIPQALEEKLQLFENRWDFLREKLNIID